MSVTRANSFSSTLSVAQNSSVNGNRLAKSLDRLSSGLRVNRFADDEAGSVIAKTVRLQMGEKSPAQPNSQDGISLIRTAEGGLNQVRGILQRMRELDVLAGNGNIHTDDIAAINSEMNELVSEIDRIVDQTTLNTTILLTGADRVSEIEDRIEDTDAVVDAMDAVSEETKVRPDLGSVRNRLERTAQDLWGVVGNTVASTRTVLHETSTGSAMPAGKR